MQDRGEGAGEGGVGVGAGPCWTPGLPSVPLSPGPHRLALVIPILQTETLRSGSTGGPGKWLGLLVNPQVSGIRWPGGAPLPRDHLQGRHSSCPEQAGRLVLPRK